MSSQIILSNITPIQTFDAPQFAALSEAWKITALQFGLFCTIAGLVVGLYFGYRYGLNKGDSDGSS